MIVRGTQAVGVVTVGMLAACLVGWFGTRAARADVDAAATVRAASEALVRQVVRKPYGAAWPAPAGAVAPADGEESDDRTGGARRAPRRLAAAAAELHVVSFDPLATPAAALLLTEAAERLSNPAWSNVAHDAGRGIMAAQDRTGRIPSVARFGRSANGEDPPAAVPDRASTRAALGVLLTLADAAEAKLPTDPTSAQKADVDRLRRNAARAANWLVKQQTRVGGWPVSVPADAPPGEGARLQRLDTSDFRDSSLALFLAAYVLDDALAQRGSQRVVVHLASMRVTRVGVIGRGLWGTAYQLDGSPGARGAELPDYGEVDLLATRNAMLALLASHLMLGDELSLTTLNEAVEALERIRPKDGPWPRFPNRRNDDAPTTAPSSPFATDDELPQWLEMDDLLAAVAAVHRVGREEAVIRLTEPVDPRRHVSAVLCGLTAEPFVPARPIGRQTPFAQGDEDERAERLRDAWLKLPNLTPPVPGTAPAAGGSHSP